MLSNLALTLLAAQLLLDALPPLRPAAAFWARLPPLPEPLLLRLRLRLLPPPLSLFLPPRDDEPSELAETDDGPPAPRR